MIIKNNNNQASIAPLDRDFRGVSHFAIYAYACVIKKQACILGETLLSRLGQTKAVREKIGTSLICDATLLVPMAVEHMGHSFITTR